MVFVIITSVAYLKSW